MAEAGIEIFLFSLNKYDFSLYSKYPNISHFSCEVDSRLIKSKVGALGKLKYLKNVFWLIKKIRHFGPDILHAHFASSYGLLGAMSFFRPYFISVWGTDIYDFPNRSLLHRLVIRFNLWRANRIFSTSNVMANETKKFTTKEIKVIPFGISSSIFYPLKKNTNKVIKIGTVKALEEKYGIKFLLEAFSIVLKRLPEFELQLLIAGVGTLENELKMYSKDLGIDQFTTFAGWIKFEDVPSFHRNLDIAVFPSICSESFGVAVIEACSCGVPVVVSNKGGLIEVVKNGETGIVVESKNSIDLANAIERLILNPDLRETMGKNGRKRVMELYEWKNNFKEMLDIYKLY